MFDRVTSPEISNGQPRTMPRLIVDLSILVLLIALTHLQIRALHKTHSNSASDFSTIALFPLAVAVNAQFSLFALRDIEHDISFRGLATRVSSGDFTFQEAGVELASSLQIIGLWASVWVVFVAALSSPGTMLMFADLAALVVAVVHMAVVCIGISVGADSPAERTERGNLLVSGIVSINRGAIPLSLAIFFFTQGAALVGRAEASSRGMSPAAFGLMALALAGMAGRWQQKFSEAAREAPEEETKWFWQRWEFLPLSFAFEAFVCAALGVSAVL